MLLRSKKNLLHYLCLRMFVLESKKQVIEQDLFVLLSFIYEKYMLCIEPTLKIYSCYWAIWKIQIRCKEKSFLCCPKKLWIITFSYEKDVNHYLVYKLVMHNYFFWTKKTKIISFCIPKNYKTLLFHTKKLWNIRKLAFC